MGLFSHLVCCWAWGFSGLVSGARFFENYGLWGGYTDEYLLGPLPPVSCPHSKPQSTPASRDMVWPRFLWNLCLSLEHSACENLCVLSKSGFSLSPGPAELLHSSPTGLQSYMLWGLLLLTTTHGSLLLGLELSLLWENFHNIIVLQFVGHPPEGYGI